MLKGIEMNRVSGSLILFLLLSVNMIAKSINYDFNGDGKADILWKKDKYYSLWYMNASGSHKYKYIGKKSSYEVVSVADFNGDGKADILWKKDKYYSLWYMNASGSHKYKYIGKKYAPYEVASNGVEATEVMSSKLFLNGNENTTSISKSMTEGSSFEDVTLGFKPVSNMEGGVSFSLKFKNGGFDVSNYYPVLCVGTQEIGSIFSFGDDYDSYNSITYSPAFNISYDVGVISKNSLITFHKDSCSNDAQPITTASSSDVVIEAKIADAVSSQGVEIAIKDFNTNSVKIKVTIKEEAQNKIPIVDAGEDKTVTVNESVTLYGSGSDVDGSVTFEWKKGSSVLGTDATLTYTPTEVGTDTLILTVTDNDGATASDSVNVVVEDSSDNPFDDVKK